MDIREHSEAHHHVIAQLIDRLGELDAPYLELDREDRMRVLAAELRVAPSADLAAARAGR